MGAQHPDPVWVIASVAAVIIAALGLRLALLKGVLSAVQRVFVAGVLALVLVGALWLLYAEFHYQ